MRLTTEIFANWLQARIDESPHDQFPLFVGRQEDMPSRSAMVTKMGFGREKFDGTFEELTFRILSRGVEESMPDAEDLAYFIDSLIDDKRNLMVGGIYVTTMYSLTKPYPLPITDRQERFQFMADYTVLASKYN